MRSRPTSPLDHRDAGGRFLRRRRRLADRRALAELECLLRRCGREEVHETSDDAGPSGLMVGAEPRSGVAVEVLEELEQVTPVRISLELLSRAVHRATPFLVPQENV